MNTAIAIRAQLELVGRRLEQVQREWSEHVIDMRRGRELIRVQWLVVNGIDIDGVNNACARALKSFAAISNIIKKGNKALERFGPVLIDHEGMEPLQEYFGSCCRIDIGTETREWQLRVSILDAQHHLEVFEGNHERGEWLMQGWLAKFVSEQRKLVKEAQTESFAHYCKSRHAWTEQPGPEDEDLCKLAEPAVGIQHLRHANGDGGERFVERRLYTLMARMARCNIKMARQSLITHYFRSVDV